jgi:hypothetical protein
MATWATVVHKPQNTRKPWTVRYKHDGKLREKSTQFVGRRIAELCIAAGAEADEVDRWVAVGQTRAELSKSLPQTFRTRRSLWLY